MSDAEKKALFLSAALTAADGKDGNFEFACPLCNGYAIGVRQSWFGSYRASCACCGFTARGELGEQKSA